MSYLLCIDLGSSVCKSVIYDLEFHEVSRAYRDIATTYPKPRWAEQDPEEWWKATVSVVRETIDKGRINPKDIAGVGVCGQSHGPVLLDKNGKVLFPCIVWPDLRAIKQSEFIKTHIGREVSAYYTAAKLLWIKEKYPKRFNKMYKFVLPKDYVRMRLTGRILTDVGDAMGTMMCDRDRGSWDYSLIDLIGISHDRLPEIYPSDKIVGSVTAEASHETGLKEDTLVIAGTGDARCTLLGLGDAIRPGRVVVYLGSAPSIFTSTRDGQLVGGFMGPGGQSLKWFKELLCSKHSELSYRILDMEAEEVEPGSGGVFFFPHLMGERGPFYNPYAKGVIFGLSLGHKRGHIVRAMMEGVIFHLKLISSNRIKRPEQISEIIAVGGGAKSSVWRQIIADMFDIPVCLPDREETGTLGLALLLSVSLGIYSNISESSKKVGLRIIERTTPRKTYHQKYEKMFSFYVKLENALSNFYSTSNLI